MRVFVCFFAMCLAVQFSVLNSFAAKEPGQQKQTQRQEVTPDVLTEAGVTTVGKRRFEIEPGLQYSHNTSNTLELTGITLPGFVIGLINVQKIRRDILIPSLTARFGISDWFQVNVKVPWVFRWDKYTVRSGDESGNTPTENTNDNDLGDIEAGIFINILREKGSRPQLYGGFKVKSDTGRSPYDLDKKTIAPGITVPTELPTGSGHWAIEPYLTLVKTFDPAVVFINTSYFWHIKSNEKIEGESLDINPSDSINYSFGMAYALNDKLAVSTSYEQKFYNRLKIDGEKIDDTDPTIANLSFGVSYAFSPSVSTNVNVAIGLTEDSPDVQLNISIPYRYTF